LLNSLPPLTILSLTHSFDTRARGAVAPSLPNEVIPNLVHFDYRAAREALRHAGIRALERSHTEATRFLVSFRREREFSRHSRLPPSASLTHSLAPLSRPRRLPRRRPRRLRPSPPLRRLRPNPLPRRLRPSPPPRRLSQRLRRRRWSRRLRLRKPRPRKPRLRKPRLRRRRRRSRRSERKGVDRCLRRIVHITCRNRFLQNFKFKLL